MAVTLQAIADDIPGSRVQGQSTAAITGIAYDHRSVRPGFLFVCVQGFRRDGHDYAAAAAAKGARALLVQKPLPLSMPQIVVDDTRAAMGRAAASFYGDPSRELQVVGVTGTNGKTTTSYLIQAALEAAGKPCGLISTVAQFAGKSSVPAGRTTPESVDIQRLMHTMQQHGLSACVMEVSSHGLALKRTVGVDFDVAVMTNVTRDHFDFHGDMETYVEAKLALFQGREGRSPSQAVINGDDPRADTFKKAAAKASVCTYGLRSHCDVRAEDIKATRRGTSFTARTPWGSFVVDLQIPGRFNVYNALAALAASLSLGSDGAVAAHALGDTVVPGRFQPVHCGQDFTVIVDYAHTADSLENALATARSMCTGQLIAVFGAGGDRDPGKRPLMGRVAASLADRAIFTADNPRSETPSAICAQIAAGVHRSDFAWETISDRAAAIHNAIHQAQPGDVVLIAGKGHETEQIIGDETIHFDDRLVALDALREAGHCG